MSDSDIFLKVPSMDENAHLQGISLVDDNQSDILSQALVSTEEVKLSDSPVQWGYVIDTDSKLNLKMQSSPATITLIKIGGIEDLNPLNYTTHIAPPLNQIHRVVIDDEILNDQLPEMIVPSKIKDKSKKKYMPPLPQTEPAVICQNCDASFATKYYYQRHQCEFNASKVMLKSELPKRNIEKPKTKHECDICHKSFMTEHNLDRHRLSHGEKKPFICQNCGKGFVLESRLNTHIENHCKMTSGEKKRFYRSDLSVWECWNCKLITAKEPNDVVHICNSQMPTFIITKNCIQPNDNQENKENDPKTTFPHSTATSKPTQESVKIVKILGENNYSTTTENFILNNFDANFEKAMSGIDLFSQPEPGFYKEAASTKNVRIVNDNNNMKIDHTFVKIRVEQLFQCEYCNRTYAKKDILKDHQNSHTVNKNYLCMFCEESFESYTNAIVHWQHKCDNKWNVFCLPKIVVCKFCDKGFKSHELLYAHKYKLRHFVPKVCKDGRNESSKQSNRPDESDFNSKRIEGTERGSSEVKKDVIYSTINISFDDNTRIRTLTIDDLTKLSLDMPDNNKSVVDISNGEINVSDINIQDILMDSNNTSVKTDNGCENESTNQPINDYEYNEIDKFLNEIERKVLDNKGLCDRAADNDNNMTSIKMESIEILDDMVQDEINLEEPFKKRLRRSLRKCNQTENVEKENVAEKDENFEKNKRGRKKSSEFFKFPLPDINKRLTRNSLKNLVEKENIVRNENLEDETIEKKKKPEETELTVNIKLEHDDDKSDKTDEDTDSTTVTVVTPVPSKRGRKPKPKLNMDPPVINECADGFRFQCEKCGSCAQTIDDLISHRSDVHGSKFDCKECGQVVHSSKALMIHCRAHQSLKPFVCDQCGRSYSQTSHLWQHMRFHQGIKPFACPHEGCEARYTIRPDLKDHIRKVHTRERPFRCAVCGKCFLTGSVYYQHRLIHNNDRRYGCDMCGKRFFRADALNNHRRIHTDERPFPCPVCGREFRQKGDRNKHHRTQHPAELAQSLVANTSIISI